MLNESKIDSDQENKFLIYEISKVNLLEFGIDLSEYKRKIYLESKIKHPNIFSPFEVFETEDSFYHIFDDIKRISLYKHVKLKENRNLFTEVFAQ